MHAIIIVDNVACNDEYMEEVTGHQNNKPLKQAICKMDFNEAKGIFETNDLFRWQNWKYISSNNGLLPGTLFLN